MSSIRAVAAGILALGGRGSLGLLKPVAFPGRLERRQKTAGWSQGLSLTEGIGGKESFSDRWTWPNTGLHVNQKKRGGVKKDTKEGRSPKAPTNYQDKWAKMSRGRKRRKSHSGEGTGRPSLAYFLKKVQLTSFSHQRMTEGVVCEGPKFGQKPTQDIISSFHSRGPARPASASSHNGL